MFQMRKKYVGVILLCAIFVFVVVFSCLFPTAKASMNVNVTKGSVKIITGTVNDTVARTYSTERQDFLVELAQNKPTEYFSAVATMDDYYTIEQINQLVSEYALEIERVYMWKPGETGKLVLSITDNDIYSAIDAFLERMSARSCGEAQQKDLEKLANGEFKVYALTIFGSAQELQNLSDTASEFTAVDVKYNPDAEAYATARGMSYSYVELPSKPDGAN